MPRTTPPREAPGGAAHARRSYGQHCGLAAALDVLGERWTLLLVRDLALGPKRFTELARRVPGMGRNLLAARLRALQDAGVVERRARAYALTARGEELRPALDALAAWGLRELPADPAPATARAGWAALTMRAGADREAARGLDVAVGFAVGEERLLVHVRDGDVAVGDAGWPAEAAAVGGGETGRRRAAQPAAPAAVATCDLPAFLALGRRALDLDAALAGGRLAIDGDEDAVRAVLRVLRFPGRDALAPA